MLTASAHLAQHVGNMHVRKPGSGAPWAGAKGTWQSGALSGLIVSPRCKTIRQRAKWSPAPAARERFSICGPFNSDREACCI